MSNEGKKTVLWRGCAIIRLSESMIGTMDPPSRKRSSVRFLFFINSKNCVAIHDHRDRSKISSKVYGSNKELLQIDFNRRAEVTINRRSDGTEYIVLGNAPDNATIIYALKEVMISESGNAEWTSPPNKTGAVITVKKFKDDLQKTP